MFIDLETIKAAEHLFRNYDREWAFVHNMDLLADYVLHDNVIVKGENPQCVGLYLRLPLEISNDNKLGSL